ncbi:class I SAM-dependent methyltransferase [Geobacter argillaceus]|uniref:Methyltransferase family protein n=1 Tax=Geobacter argillaceus TaxID=345631 RepID=A0A562WS13_9BACT|nr:class I SAM-dependent methyltransferase [Geobacter argillaceus]TWJ33051.1 methyltransferase family protein [Geobacter argillaceus]
MEQYLKIIMSIEHSNTSAAECANLYTLARNINKGCIVEIGSYHGRTSVALALAVQATGLSIPVYCIEPHDYSKGIFGHEFGSKDRVQFFRNMLKANVVETIRLVNLSSLEASKAWDTSKPISLLWIDGDHTYEGAKIDFDCWESFVPVGGIIAIHDTLPPFTGPKQIVDEALASGRYQQIDQVERNAVLVKVKA